MKLWIPLVIALVTLTGLPPAASADPVPTTMSFVARLADSGVPVTGTHDLQLQMFDAATNGTSKWLEPHDAVVIPADGVVFLVLGGTVPLDATVFDGGPRFLEIAIDGVTSSSRIPVGSAPYAVRAGVCANADHLQSHLASDFQIRIASACGTGQSIQAINADGSVACETDQDTKFTAGAGLTLSGNAFSVDPSLVQARVSGSCVAGKYIRAIDATGAVTCDVDANTVFTAGSGLQLVGSAFSVNTSVIQARVSGTCGAGQAVQAIDGSGGVTCEPNIANQSASAQTADLFISGTVHTSGLVRAGSESGGTDAPTANLADYSGVVHRRLVSKTAGAGTVIARTDLLQLTHGANIAELDVTFTKPLPTAASIDCYGVDSAANPIAASLSFAVGETCGGGPTCTQQVFAAVTAVSGVTCTVGGIGHTTQVTMHRTSGVWTGFVTSDFNQ